jgi:hypothetical protein
VLRGWGTPRHAEEFNYTGPPKSEMWSVYKSAGHNGNGLRSRSQVSWFTETNPERIPTWPAHQTIHQCAEPVRGCP